MSTCPLFTVWHFRWNAVGFRSLPTVGDKSTAFPTIKIWHDHALWEVCLFGMYTHLNVPISLINESLIIITWLNGMVLTDTNLKWNVLSIYHFCQNVAHSIFAFSFMEIIIWIWPPVSSWSKVKDECFFFSGLYIVICEMIFDKHLVLDHYQYGLAWYRGKVIYCLFLVHK